MKIALFGYGRMGHEIERLALSRGHEICVRFDVDDDFRSGVDLGGAQVLIDFSHAAAVRSTLHTAAVLQLPVVEGTTGWSAELIRVLDISGLSLIYSANFSIGVYRFHQLVRLAGQLYGATETYDAYVHEWHHRGKADSPSGSALMLGKTLLESMPHMDTLVTHIAEGKIPNNALHVTSTRVGHVPGTHEVGFNSCYDHITLTHQSFGREAFAFGALAAAQWIIDRKGIFTMNDFMEDQK